MKTCYDCGEPLTSNNRSLEHVINNSIGGRLTSYDLLCKMCNQSFGSGLDTAISGAFNVLANHLDISRQRGKVPDVMGTISSTGEKIIIAPGGKLKPSHTRIDELKLDGRTQFSISAPNMKEAKKTLKGLQRKYNLTDEQVEEFMKTAKASERRINEHVNHSIEIGGNLIFKAINKMAINFYLLKGGERVYITKAVNALKSEEACDSVWFLNSPDMLFSYPEKQICHSLHVVGSSDTKFLYCIVDLFSTAQYIVILNKDYNGRDIRETYTYDIINQQVINSIPPNDLHRDRVLSDVIEGKDTIADFIPRLERLLGIGMNNRYIKNKVENIFDRFYELHKGADFLNDPDLHHSMIADFVAHEFLPEIRAASESRHREAERKFKEENQIVGDLKAKLNH